MIMDISKNVRWIIPFKKFGMVRVKNSLFVFSVQNRAVIGHLLNLINSKGMKNLIKEIKILW